MAISKATTAAITLALSTVMIPTSVLATTTVDISTGTTGPGTTDPAWTIRRNVAPVGPAYVPEAVPNSWAGDAANGGVDGAHWITPGANGNGNTGFGVFTYSTVFTLSNAANLSTWRINGQFWADNLVSAILLNGVTIFTNGSFANQYGDDQFGTLTNVGAGRFVAGQNSLRFITLDGTAQEGFMASLTASGAVPEPGAWLLMLMGFGFIGFQMRRRQQTNVRFQFT